MQDDGNVAVTCSHLWVVLTKHQKEEIASSAKYDVTIDDSILLDQNLDHTKIHKN